MASDPPARLTVSPVRPATLVDSSVILDIVTGDPSWGRWSEDALATAGDEGQLVINPIVYAEVSVGFDQIEELDDAIPADDFRRGPLPYDAGFLAGKAYLAYRRRGGHKRSPLPDFYIGAHSAVRGYRLLTRDAARYGTYFPTSLSSRQRTTTVRKATSEDLHRLAVADGAILARERHAGDAPLRTGPLSGREKLAERHRVREPPSQGSTTVHDASATLFGGLVP